MNQHDDIVRSIGASALGFVAWAMTHASLDRWLGTIAGALGICLVLLTIAEKLYQCRLRRLRNRRRAQWRSRRRENGFMDGAVLLFGTALLMSGCATPPAARPDPAASVQSAGARLAEAQEANAAARAAASAAREGVAKAQGKAGQIVALARKLAGEEGQP